MNRREQPRLRAEVAARVYVHILPVLSRRRLSKHPTLIVRKRIRGGGGKEKEKKKMKPSLGMERSSQARVKASTRAGRISLTREGTKDVPLIREMFPGDGIVRRPVLARSTASRLGKRRIKHRRVVSARAVSTPAICARWKKNAAMGVRIYIYI